MPRAQVYITQNNYKRIQSIVDAKKEDGADRTEANVSSVAAMLLDIGLRVYEFQQKKEQEGEVDSIQESNDLPDPLMFNKVLLENILKASYASTTLLQMIGNLDEVKNIDSFNYENVKVQIRDKIDDQLIKVFSKD
ncbi:relaxosome protein TraM [Hafnia paralvei]|uniref:relaxosome protein TraM n=1 Tax=Hafnia paralvei TaxID=546367 RepID=UPI001E131B37|nr:relaxosome protein TraM [Escherichia coli]EKK2790667.1 relaxosome protein TraM [Salmonella enterica]